MERVKESSERVGVYPTSLLFSPPSSVFENGKQKNIKMVWGEMSHSDFTYSAKLALSEATYL